MNRLRLLFAMPWVASAPFSRWTVALTFCGLSLLGLLFGAEVAMGKLDSSALVWLVGFAIWWLWSAYVSANFQLARDARLLRLPGIARDADLSMLLFAVPGIVVPVSASWLLGAPQPFTTAFFLTAMAGGLAYILLPLYLGIPLTVSVVLLLLTRGASMSTDAWFALIMVLIAIAAWRWWVLRTPRLDRGGNWNTPAVFYCYRIYTEQRGGWIPTFSQSLLQKQLAKPVPLDLHAMGPDRPVTSLRVVLGGFGMPKPMLARLRDVAPMAGYVVIFLFIFVLPQALSANQHLSSASEIRLHWVTPLLVFFCVSMCLLAVTAFAGRTLATWRKPDAEVALLALLPGFGALHSKRDVLHALLLPAAVFLGATAVVLGLGALSIHARWSVYLAITLACLGAFGLVVAYTFEMLGGRGVHMAAYLLSNLILFLLTILIAITSLPTDQYRGAHPERIGVTPIWVLALWAIFLLVVAAFALRGWRGLRKRPHPFLATPR